MYNAAGLAYLDGVAQGLRDPEASAAVAALAQRLRQDRGPKPASSHDRSRSAAGPDRVPVTTLAPGPRLVVWTQGCPLACRGCMSRDT